MNKFLPVILLVAVAGVVWFTLSSDGGGSGVKTASGPDRSTRTKEASGKAIRDGMIRDIQSDNADPDAVANFEDGEDPDFYDERNAVERYTSLDAALKAVKDGAVDYDDLVLDQFTDLPQNCAWCNELYQEVRSLALSADTKPEQRSFYAEILAVSGRLENIQTIVEAIKGAKNQDEADIFAEALELAVGKDDIVKYLGDQLEGSGDTLRESSVAAITNQGSRLAVEMLRDHTMKQGDADGYYSVGIGLGELVPEPEAYPLLQEMVAKRDQYSHLGVKALLNSGLDGLRIVVDSLANSPNPEFDANMLESAKDHVTFDEETMAYLREVAEKSPNQSLQAFARETLEEFRQMELEAAQDEDHAEEDEEPFTPVNPAG
jgi:hypothetical protein